MSEPLLVTLKRAGEVLAVSPRTVRRLIDAGQLAPIRIGRSLRLSATDLAAYVDRQMSHRHTSQRAAVPEIDTCRNVKADGEKGFTNGHVRRSGGPSIQTDAGGRLAVRLGFPSRTTKTG